MEKDITINTVFTSLGDLMGYEGYVYFSYGVRPVISLVAGVRSIDGDGTVNDPFIVE